MSRAQLTNISVENFKAYAKRSSLPVRPLTILIGRNNSGKSSLIQALLLLQQTLGYRRPEVPLHLEGIVDAYDLRELTSGWPDRGAGFNGPAIAVSWRSRVDLRKALGPPSKWPDIRNLREHSEISWLKKSLDFVDLHTSLRLSFSQGKDGSVFLRHLRLESKFGDEQNPAFDYRTLMTSWGRSEIERDKLAVEFQHFLPILRAELKKLGPRDRHRSYFYGFRILYEQPLEDLEGLLRSFAYLSSDRDTPKSLYRPANSPLLSLGVSGEEAPRVLHSRQQEFVHYLPPLDVSDAGVSVPATILQKELLEATNDVLEQLGVSATVSIEEVKDAGFRVLFGQANLPHVGRGLGYLLPTVMLGLMAAPPPGVSGSSSVEDYLSACDHFIHGAIEEAEIHLHPKVQSRLAHWLVSLGMAGRRLIVETHSDHLVRRLRGLIARAESGSQLETWLRENVVVAEVEQGDDKRSTIRASFLTPAGVLEQWPAGFMDEAVDEERVIYTASLEKQETEEDYSPDTQFVEPD